MRILSCLALAASLLAAAWSPGDAADATTAGTGVLTFHASAARSGHYIVPGLTWAAAATAHLDHHFGGRVKGHSYAQPLYWRAAGAAHGMLIVATESNIVQAIDADTGAEIWHQFLGHVVPQADLPCANISPLGVTGTPVVDAATGTLFLDAFVLQKNTGPQHLVFGLSLTDGAILPGWPVDIAHGLARHGLTFTPTFQTQRSALSLLHGRLYVAFGNSGDCNAYRGWVVGVDVAAPPRVVGAWVTNAQRGGIWAVGALAFDGASLFVATGNTYGASVWGDGEAIIRMPLDLSHSASTQDYFAPSNWQTLDANDADLGGTGPLPVDAPAAGGTTQKLLLALGKDGNAYLLDRANLGGIGGQLLVQQVATGEIITAATTYPAAGVAMAAFHASGAACPPPSTGSTLVALAVTAGNPPSLHTAWCANFSGAGAPIATTSDSNANPIVWMVGGEGDERLHGFRGDTGAALFTGGAAGDAVAGVRHLSTLIAAEGRLYVGGDGRIFAFGFTPALP